MLKQNIFDQLPSELPQELFQDLCAGKNIRIERIVSKGHSSPNVGWYDQDEHEWVMVLEGHAIIGFEDGKQVEMLKGDHLNIPAHCKHKVSWSDPQQTTVWLAVFHQ